MENKYNKYIKTFFQIFFLLFCGAASIAQQKPVADFTVDNKVGCGLLVAQFTDKSANNPNSWSWKFYQNNSLDTLSSNLQNPVFAFNDIGLYNVSLTVSNNFGKSSVVKKSLVSVRRLPSANFTANKTGGCVPSTVIFSYQKVLGDTTIKKWQWDFGDGSSSTIQNPTHSYTSPGNYNVTLIVDDASGCENKYNNYTINISPKPKSSFTVLQNQSCQVPFTANFNNTSTGSNLTYLWWFDGGNSLTQQNPTYVYNNSGYHDVSLVVTDINGCKDSLTQKGIIQINTFKTNFYTTTIRSGCPSLTVNFKDSSSSGANSWKWNFGDGGSSTLQNPSYKYLNPGIYTVTFQSGNSVGCAGSKTITNYITIYNNPNVQFTANDSTNCTVPFNVNFTDNTLQANSWLWNFGDGATDITKNPTHTYTSNNNFTVSLTVKDVNGCSNTMTAKNLIKITKATVSFNASNQSGCSPLSTNFQNFSSSTVPIKTWLWYFGDGSTSTLKNPSHIYNDTGTYNVSLVFADSMGCKDSATTTKLISVGNPPVVNFFGDDTVGCHPLTVNFTGAAKFANLFNWDFGDQKSGSGQTVTHVYDTTGYMSVTLTASQYNCKSKLTKINYIHILPPRALFTILNPTSCVIPFTATLINRSSSADKSVWNFMDGTPLLTTNQDTINHTFYTRDYHFISLSISNNTFGCIDSVKKYVTISNLKPGYKQNLQSFCMYNNATFTDTSYTNTKLKEWRWNFGDGKTLDTTAGIAKHTYITSGIYSVSLIITDQINCKDTIAKINNVKVNKLPSPKFVADKTAGCAPLQVSFTDLSVASNSAKLQIWSWNFGDKTISNTQNPTHIFNSNGKFNITLTITDSLGCDSTLTKVNYIYVTNPVASFGLNKAFNLSDTLSCFPDSAHFTNNSTGDGLKYAWNFKDGSPINSLVNPTHFFSEDTTTKYKVTLTATDANNCTSTFVKNITISHPVALFGGNPRYADCPYPIKYFNFTDSSSKDVNNWLWNFGDLTSGANNTSVINKPQHSYINSGYYDVSLIVKNKYGCSDTLTKKQYIFINGPSGSFDFATKNGCPPLKATFIANANRTDHYQWIFGDGNSITTTSDSVTYIYYNGGKIFTPSLILESKTTVTGDSICRIPVNAVTCNGKKCDSINVYALPPASAGQDKEICSGQNVSLTATGGISYKWNNGETTDVITEELISTTTYIVSVSDTICTNTATVKVTVDSLPKANAGKDTTVCPGQTVVLTATGGEAYNWNQGETTALITVNPTVKTIYAVSVTDIKGCVASSYVIVFMADSLPVTISGKTAICSGERANLTAGGGSIYSWSSGETTSNLISNVLIDSASYTVLVSNDAGCFGKKTVNININPLPVITVIGGTICSGASTVISAFGANTYNWNSNNGNGSFITVNPSGITTYTVTGTNATTGCMNTAQNVVMVNPLPVITTAGNIICRGISTIISATGADAYVWSDNLGYETSVAVNPVITTTYSVTGTSSITGCQNNAKAIVMVKPLPTLEAVGGTNGPICAGASTVISVDGADTYNWSNNLGTGISLIVNPTTITTYIVTGTSAITGCMNTAQAVVIVNQLPIVNIGSNKQICQGESINLSASGGTIYSWNTGEKIDVINVKPLINTLYAVIVTDNNGCSSKDSVTVFVKMNPTLTVVPDTTICAGSNVSLTATGNGNIYYWDNGSNSPIINIAPAVSTTYTVTVFNSDGCSRTTNVPVTVISAPSTPVIPEKLVCFNEAKTPQNVILSVKNSNLSYDYVWYNLLTGGTMIDKGAAHDEPNVTSGKTFYVEAVSPEGCKSLSRGTAVISAGNKPNAQFTFDSILPVSELAEVAFTNQSQSNTASDNMEYYWSFENGLSFSTYKDPTYQFRDSGKFEIQLIAFNSDQCSDTLNRSIKIVMIRKMIWIPDAFTPNGDGNNDKLFVRGHVQTLYFAVYNQLGYKIFDTEDQSNGWDGKYHGIDQPQGNYTWILRATTSSGQNVSEQGMVILLR